MARGLSRCSTAHVEHSVVAECAGCELVGEALGIGNHAGTDLGDRMQFVHGVMLGGSSCGVSVDVKASWSTGIRQAVSRAAY